MAPSLNLLPLTSFHMCTPLTFDICIGITATAFTGWIIPQTLTPALAHRDTDKQLKVIIILVFYVKNHSGCHECIIQMQPLPFE